MAIERNGDTVIRVYTSNMPPSDAPDEAQYVRRAGRAQAGTRRVPVGRVAGFKAALRRMRRQTQTMAQTSAASEEARAWVGVHGGQSGAGDTKVWVKPRPRHEAPRSTPDTDKADGASVRRHALKRRLSVRHGASRRGAAGRQGMSRQGAGRLAREALVVCAVLMCVASLKVLPFGWAQQATSVMASAVNMSVDLDKTLGQLQFVREVIPDSAMVFFSGDSGYSAPFEGEITHSFSEDQPWLEYLGDSQAVNCVRAGKVTQLEQGTAGDWAVRVDHGDGLESIYAFLSEVNVREGDSVAGAQQLGRADGQSGARIYFEMRLNGEPVDPTTYLGAD